METLLHDILDDLSALESTLSDLENELLCDAAFESVLFGESDIALEANIIQKIKSGIAKLKSGKKKEGKKDLDEAVDELKEAEKEVEESGDEEKKKKLSKAAKIGIGIGAAAILAAAGIAAKKGMSKKASLLKKMANDATNTKQTQNASSSQLSKTMNDAARVVNSTPYEEFEKSIAAARAAGVDEKKILKNVKDIDNYFMGDDAQGMKSNARDVNLEKRVDRINKLIRAYEKIEDNWFSMRRDNSYTVQKGMKNTEKRQKIEKLIKEELAKMNNSEMDIVKKKILDPGYIHKFTKR